jgi:hypothetical protein
MFRTLIVLTYTISIGALSLAQAQDTPFKIAPSSRHNAAALTEGIAVPASKVDVLLTRSGKTLAPTFVKTSGADHDQHSAAAETPSARIDPEGRDPARR